VLDVDAVVAVGGTYEGSRRPELRDALWPELELADFRAQFRARELRRELLSSMARPGHPLIDLYASAMNALGTLSMGARHADDEEIDDVRLIEAYADMLQSQHDSDSGWNGFQELKSAADHFDLILMTNEPEARNVPLFESSRLFGRLLRAQEPIAGMHGQVNETLVRQFRMPGYPFILITTELLKEGEDLHTFCSNVVHYGIAWMPSSMEQRVGRIDRGSSLTERRLTFARTAAPGNLLQVYYPYLRETVERVQVERVLRRQHDFLRLLHTGFGAPSAVRTIDLNEEATRAEDPLELITVPLETAYPVRPEMLGSEDRPLALEPTFADTLSRRFLSLQALLALQAGDIDWEATPPSGALMGTLRMKNRVQPFTLLLRSTHGLPLLRCVSPVGVYHELRDEADALLRMAERAGVRVCALHDPKMDSYNLTIEGDVLLSTTGDHDVDRGAWLLASVTGAADRAERLLLKTDHPMSTFRSKLGSEVDFDR
jgi:hypothetical protein